MLARGRKTSMRRLRRWLVLIGGGALLSLASGHDQAALAQWQSIAPEKAGFAADLADRLDRAVQADELPNLHAVVVARAGRLVLERYDDGPRRALGRAARHDRLRPGGQA
jgi:hypothetical protein